MILPGNMKCRWTVTRYVPFSKSENARFNVCVVTGLSYSIISNKSYYTIREIKRLLNAKKLHSTEKFMNDLINHHKLHAQQKWTNKVNNSGNISSPYLSEVIKFQIDDDYFRVSRCTNRRPPRSNATGYIKMRFTFLQKSPILFICFACNIVQWPYLPMMRMSRQLQVYA